MRRWAIWLLAAVILGGSAYVAWARTRQRLVIQDQEPEPYQPSSEDRVEVLVEELTNEFFQHKDTKPSSAARNKIRELAERGQKSNDAAILFEKWLKQMFSAEEGGNEAFREVARALLVVEPDVPRRVVKMHYLAQTDSEQHFAELQLIAFGKASLPALLQGLKDEAGNAAFVRLPEKSRLPAVLGDLGSDALPTIVLALQDSSAHVRGQAVRALRRMDPNQAAAAVPELVKLLEDAGRSDVHLAVVKLLGDFGPRARPATPVLERIAEDRQATELREAARALLEKTKTK